jgi:phospholipid/cholesterol/gamma-HCH transport system substrate-binding protein
LSTRKLASIKNLCFFQLNDDEPLVALINHQIALKVQKGEGSLGRLIYDSNIVISLDSAIFSIKRAGNQVNNLSQELRNDVSSFNENLQLGKGTIPVLLNDSNMAIKVNQTLENIEKSADNFNQNMEALKHSIFFRGYFRKKANKAP